MERNEGVARFELREILDAHDWKPRLDRRAAVRLLTMSAAAAAAGCGSGGTAASSISAAGATGSTATVTVLSSSASSVSQAASVTLTARVTPAAATGAITFYDGSTVLGSASLSVGTASFTTSFPSAGTQTLTAAYAGDSAYVASTSAAVTLVVTSSASCSATLEGEEGPYFTDDSASGYLRSDVTSNLDGSSPQAGIPLALTVYVFDAKKSCIPMTGVQVDIWSCNASGVYSNESVESTLGQSWLRGYQISDAAGKVQFGTIFPGWYSGRTTHIHMRLRSTYDQTSNSGSNTMQVFFDQTVIDTLATTVAPYSKEGTNPTTNASDRVYSQQEVGTTLLTLSGSASTGYSATVNVYLPI